MMILRVGLEMFGEVTDALAEEGNLHLRRAGVCGVGLVRADDFQLTVFGERHCFLHARSRTRRRKPPPHRIRRILFGLSSNESIFYTRTITGCKSPAGLRSAIPRSMPLPSSRRHRSPLPGGVSDDAESARSADVTSFPWVALRMPRSFSTTPGRL